LAKTPVRVAVPPEIIVVGLATKLVMVAGFGSMVTVVDFVTAVPVEGVTVRVYVVVDVGETLIAVPLVIGTTVLSAESETDPVPLVNTPVSAAFPPEAISVGFAVKLVMVGAAGVDELLPPPPQATMPKRQMAPAKNHAWEFRIMECLQELYIWDLTV
jgi:hypothetical protein